MKHSEPKLCATETRFRNREQKPRSNFGIGIGGVTAIFETLNFCQLTLKSMKVQPKNYLTKVHLFLDHSYAILSSFKIMIIFNNTSAKIKTKSADVLLKIITILKELRIAQLCC